MSPRRNRPVTLAGSARHTGPRETVKPGHEDATPERLMLARKDGAAEIDAQGVRRLADPFDVLRARGLLDKGPEMNDVLWHAGTRFREHWHGARMSGAGAMDLVRDVVDGGTGVMGLSQHIMGHLDELRAANRAIGPRCAAFVAGVVLEGATVASLAHLVVDTGHARTREALALDRLREGLHRLCDLWGMKPDKSRRALRGWRGFTELSMDMPEQSDR